MSRTLCYSVLTNVDAHGHAGVELLEQTAALGLSVEEIDAATVKVIGSARTLALFIFRRGFEDVTIIPVERTPPRLEVVA